LNLSSKPTLTLLVIASIISIIFVALNFPTLFQNMNTSSS
jgi:hypothetical protein